MLVSGGFENLLQLPNMYKFEDFAELEKRIGTVADAERVAGTDRLIKIIADMGNEKI